MPFIVVVLLAVSYNLHLKKHLNDANINIQRYDKEVALMNNSVQNIINCRLLEAQSEGCKLSPNIVIYEGNGNIFYLSDAITEPTLVFRFTEMHCISCIENGLKLLNETCSSTKLPVVIFCQYESIRKVRAISNSYNIKVPIYNISEAINIPLDDISTSYFFIIDENLKCHGFQSFLKEVPIITETYLNGICY